MPRTITAADRSRLIRLASSMPVGSPERKAVLTGIKKTAASPADRVLFLVGNRNVQKQTVVVLQRGFKAFPPDLFDGKDWHSQEVLDAEAKKAAALVRRGDVLGYGLYEGKLHIFTTFVILPGGKEVVRLPGHGGANAKDVTKLVHQYHKKLQRDVNQAARELDGELAKHDWYAAMSDDPGKWRGAERHMDDVITPLLLTVPRDVGITIWKKHAPTKAKGGLYTDDPYEKYRLASMPKLAKMDLYREWRDTYDKLNINLHKAYSSMLAKVANVFAAGDWKLVLKKSSLGHYNHGSDGARMEGLLVFEDLRNEARGDRETEDWLDANLDYSYGLKNEGYGKWELDITES